MRSGKIPVENHPGLVRDVSTGAIVSVDKNAVRAYEQRKQKQKSDAARLNKLEEELAVLRSIVDELRKRSSP